MNYFDTTVNSTDYLMTVNGLFAGLNMPEALHSKGEGEFELAHGLPPYRPRRAYLVDEYPACPDSWMRSSGRVKSYFVPIMEDTGLWLDFNACSRHSNHTAIVISVQGVNAVTGLPCKDAQLEQYRDQCPKHKEPFGPDRLCKKCNFKWPKQNYLPSTGTPLGALWLDGFRAEDGKVRQYVFTEKKIRSVAKAIIGEDRVFALGISFFLSKEPRPVVHREVLRGYHSLDSSISHFMGDETLIGSDTAAADFGSDTANVAPPSTNTGGVSWSANIGAKGMSMGTPAIYNTSTGPTMKISASTEKYSAGPPAKKRLMSAGPKGSLGGPITAKLAAVKQLEIAAGARIDQQVYDDPNDLSYWNESPEGILVINYVTQREALAVIRAGKIDLSGSKEGFLTGIPTGNS